MSIKDIAKQHSNESVVQEDFEEPWVDFGGYEIPQSQYEALTSLHKKLGRKALDAYGSGLITIENDVGVVGYHFYDNKLSELPSEIRDLTTLKWLKVSGENVESLPDWLTEFKDFMSIFVGYSNIKEGGLDVIGKLEDLEYLRTSTIDYNLFSDTLPNLKKLKLLEIKHATNVDVDRLPKFQYLEQLEIDCGRDFEQVGDSIGDMTSLKRLDLGGNHLSSVPESIGNLKGLNYLDLSINCLESLPESIGNLESLDYLNLRNNRLKWLPESITNLSNLTQLNVSANFIGRMPKNLRRMKKLWNFQRYSNRLNDEEEHRVGKIFKRKMYGN